MSLFRLIADLPATDYKWRTQVYDIRGLSRTYVKVTALALGDAKLVFLKVAPVIKPYVTDKYTARVTWNCPGDEVFRPRDEVFRPEADKDWSKTKNATHLVVFYAS